MSILSNKIDFVAVGTVAHANPNGDPLNGNMPRQTLDGYGEISDVALKRKIRNRLQDMGENIFVQSDDRNTDEFKSLRERANGNAIFSEELKKGKKASRELCAKIACEQWIDVRAFGQVFAFKGDALSLGIRGPVSIHPAFSIDTIDIDSIQITKSVNSESGKESKAADTMGMKHRVLFGAYKIKGSINVQLAEKTGFTENDAEKIKEAIKTLFVNDSSSARPDGSMEIVKLYWFKHNCKIGQYSSKKVHDSVQVQSSMDKRNPENIKVSIPTPLPDLEYEEYDGI
ncbi:MAG TPA: type I-C CRISPR-associated protein Cas7/Csd2 [Clostridiales bacterium]|nr:type I-C CRISPR-associated protein Cas7/Csd2 [Clostridiales bacterium]